MGEPLYSEVLRKSSKARRSQMASIKSADEKTFEFAILGGFPTCKGTYPDCPEKPTKDHKVCRACPVLEEILEKEE